MNSINKLSAVLPKSAHRRLKARNRLRDLSGTLADTNRETVTVKHLIRMIESRECTRLEDQDFQEAIMDITIMASEDRLPCLAERDIKDAKLIMA